MVLPSDWSRSFDHIKNKTAFYIHDIVQWSDVELRDLDSWLSNFPDDIGQYIAIRLLNRFIYYSEKDVKRLLDHGLYKVFLYHPSITWVRQRRFTATSEEAKQAAARLVSEVVFVPLLDRNKPSESGNVLCRYINRDLGVPSTQICQPEDLLNVKNKKVLILDDFIGSGQQIIDFWNVPKLAGRSVAEIAAANRLEMKYLSLVATRYGLNRIATSTLGLEVLTCEILEDTYRVFHTPSLYFGSAPDVVAAKQYLTDLCKRRKIRLLGFHSLDYALAFHHAVPDATLPLFYKSVDQWKPLIKRRQG